MPFIKIVRDNHEIFINTECIEGLEFPVPMTMVSRGVPFNATIRLKSGSSYNCKAEDAKQIVDLLNKNLIKSEGD